MTVRQVRRLLSQRGCTEVRQAGSHLTIRCGECVTTIAVHGGDIPPGTLAKIGHDLEPCLGKGWLRK
ncbi:MAG: type II toxin-antitoxin system HicA family toxin [Acidimicrobiales bacterium]